MEIESGEHLSFGFNLIRQGGSELQTAPLTHAQVRTTAGDNDTEFSLRHTPSLPPTTDPVEIEWHHYRSFRYSPSSRPVRSGRVTAHSSLTK